LLVFERADAASGNAVVVAVNRGPAEASASVPVPAGWQGAAIKDAITNTPVALTGDQLAVSVPARQARVYVRVTGT
jgi:hypothetical protein